MKKLRKMLGSADSPYIVSLMRLIETQSKVTIANWCINYTKEFIMPIFTKKYPYDKRPQLALIAAADWLNGKIKLPEAKRIILDCHACARELENNPAAQAAVRAIGQAAAVIHTPTHSLGMAFYGAAAIAYDRIGFNETQVIYDKIAAEECNRMEMALRQVAIENEPYPARVNWNC